VWLSEVLKLERSCVNRESRNFNGLNTKVNFFLIFPSVLIRDLFIFLPKVKEVNGIRYSAP
jgi:hypothetical protein